MPQKKNPDQPHKSSPSERERTDDDRLPQRRDGAIEDDTERVGMPAPDTDSEPENDDTPPRADEQRDEEADLDREARRGDV